MDYYRDYVEDIGLDWPNCLDVKDPFAIRVGKSIHLEQVSRWWTNANNYVLAFNSKYDPMPLPFMLFAHKNGSPCRVVFRREDNVPKFLERGSYSGLTFFVSDSIHQVKNVFWKPFTALEQVLIDLDLADA